MDDLLSDFLTEANEGIAELDVALVRLERTPDDAQTLSLIFRLVHTIKGTCGFLGLPRLERVAHAAENVLGKLRDGALIATPDIITHILAALDRIKDIIGGLSTSGTEVAGDDSALIAILAAVVEGRPAEAKPPAPARTEAKAEAKIRAKKKAKVKAAVAEPVAAETQAAAADQADAMEPGAMEPETMEPEAMEAPTEADAIEADLLEPAAASGEALPANAQATQAGEPAVAVQTIRVAVDVLEDLMTMVSELVLTRNQLLQLARTQENAAFSVPLQRLSHITSELQEGVMKTRMQPIGHAWNKLPRLVRDLSRELDKKIELIMLGADTELDRQVLELIKDPLTHMVRNSGDHGLETPAQRRAAGKPEAGHITLNAFHEGGHIIIEVADDGRGLPSDKIRAKALAGGFATEAELAGMTEAQIQRFIFRPGFSTAAAVTAVSGRGVGMDVVKTNIERIGGTIDVKSTLGQGSTFSIKIPLTLAIVSALIVQAGGERFAIPQISVVELVHARTDGTKSADSSESVIEHINDTPVLRLRDRLLPLVNLSALLQLETAETPAQATRGQDPGAPSPGAQGTDAESAGAPSANGHSRGAHVIVAQVGVNMVGIIVDRVFDTEEIVVKPVAPILRHITLFSGNTILGDGSVIMILDPNGIARATGTGAGTEMRATAAVTRDAHHSGNRTAMLLFRAGSTLRLAVPLGLVARLESFERDQIEDSGGAPVTQYRGQLMPLVPFAPDLDMTTPRQPVLVFTDGERSMGLMVDEIVDVVEDRLSIELTGAQPGLLGTAVIGGFATNVIDTGHWLERAWDDWFHGARSTVGGATNRRVLVVDDSDFFRQLLVPTLSAAGYQVTAVASAAEAIALRDSGEQFHAIVSDIDMPDMDGLAFARALRESGAWSELPLIALSASAEPVDVTAGRNAGFTDYVAKFQRQALLASLAQCLTDPLPVAA